MLARPIEPKTTPTLAGQLRQRIASDGPMPVHDYMQACLSDPASGYYMSRQPFGSSGDFITAPEISQMFGELLGLWAACVWQSMGEPAQIILAELGPGRGTLMQDALRAMRGVPHFLTSVSIALIETSPALRDVQATALRGTDTPLAWYDKIEDLPGAPLILLANEFLDTLPIHQHVRHANGWHERCVGLNADGMFVFVEIDKASGPDLPPELAARTDVGGVFETRPGVASLVAALGARAKPVAAQFIDYGHEQSDFGDTLQAVRRHRFADPLEAPGKADLSAHVDFADLARRAHQAGLKSYGPLPQGEFLLKLGLETRRDLLLRQAKPEQCQAIISGAARLAGPRAMGHLFKVLAVTSEGFPPPPPFLETV